MSTRNDVPTGSSKASLAGLGEGEQAGFVLSPAPSTEEERRKAIEKLKVLTEEIRAEAERNGLTDEILEELLNED